MFTGRRYPVIPKEEAQQHLRAALARRGRWLTVFAKDAPLVRHDFPWHYYQHPRAESPALRCAAWNGLRAWVQRP